jgi:hypothetical protein
MKQIHLLSQLDAPSDVRSRLRGVISGVTPFGADLAGQDRLDQATFGIVDTVTGIDNTMTGVPAHAAVRMHVSPATGAFWAYCPKDKATHFQRWKVAN